MKRREIGLAIWGGVIWGFLLVAGKELDETLSVDLLNMGFYGKWILFALLSAVCCLLLWKVLDVISRLKGKEGGKLFEVCEWATGRWSVFILLLCWLPTWLSVYPGVFSYDAYDEWQQVCTGNITSHHPVAHVLFVGGITEFCGNRLDNYNFGIALCTAMQMVLLACTFSYTLRFLKEEGVKMPVRILALVFYGFSPIVQLFAICATKDTLYGAAMLLFVLSLYRMVKKGTAFWSNRRWLVVFVLSSLGTMIMRNNGKYIVIIMLFLCVLVSKGFKKKCILYCGIILGIYWIYVGPVYSLLGVQAGGVQEMLSVPLQQLARVYNYEEDAFSIEEINYLNALIPEECWKSYRSTVSDFVKRGFDEEVFTEAPMRFVSVWLHAGIKHPLTYVNSFLVNTVDFWYPFAVVDGYQDVYGKSSLFDYRVSAPGTEVVYIPWLHEMYESLSHDVDAQKLPGMFLLTSPGWYLMLFLFVVLTQCRKKEKKYILVMMPVMLNFLTVLLGPIALVRYVLILYFVVPIYVLALGKNVE